MRLLRCLPLLGLLTPSLLFLSAPPGGAAPTDEEYLKVKAVFVEWCRTFLDNPQFDYDVKQVECVFANGQGYARLCEAPENPRDLFPGDFNTDLGGVPAVAWQGRTAGDDTTANVSWVRGNWAVVMEKHRDQPAAEATPQVYAQFAKEAMDLAKSFDARLAFVIQTSPRKESSSSPRPKRSRVILMDGTGCMGNPSSAVARAGNLDFALDIMANTNRNAQFDYDAGRPDDGIEWALMTFDDEGTQLEHDFTQDGNITRDAYAKAVARQTMNPAGTPGAASERLATAIAHALLHGILSGRGRPIITVLVCGQSWGMGRNSLDALNRVLNPMPKPQALAPRLLSPGRGVGLFASLIWAVFGEARMLSTPGETLEQVLAQLQQAAANRPVPVQVDIIGVNVPAGSEQETALRQTTQAGGGRYVPAASIHDLPTAMAAVMPNAGTLAGPPRIASTGGQAIPGGALRTIVYHQITNTAKTDGVHVYNGQEPRISATGNRIVMSMEPAPGDATRRPRIAVMDFTGGSIMTVDTCAAGALVDLSADGRVVVSIGGDELRAAVVDGNARLLLKGPSCGSVRTNGNGDRIYFSVPAGARLQNGTVLEGGVHGIDINGGNLRLVAGVNGVAAALGVPPADVRGFYSGSRGSALDVSDDGNRVVFLVNTRGGAAPGHVFAVNGDGSGLRRIASAAGSVSAVGISGDGRQMAWVALEKTAPATRGMTAGFDGSDPRLLTEKPDAGRSISLTQDGTAVLFGSEAIVYRTDGSGCISLAPQGSAASGQRFVGDRLDCLNMSGDGRRFVYGLGVGRLYQLATVELDPADLRGAPVLSELKANPWAIRSGSQQYTTVGVRAPSALVGGAVGLTLYQAGRYSSRPWGALALRDDAGVRGDAQPGDGVYTHGEVIGSDDMPAAPWHLRLRAEVAGNGDMNHATAVEIGPFTATPTQPPMVTTQPTTAQPTTTTQPTGTQPTTTTQPTSTQPTTTLPTTTLPTTTQPTTSATVPPNVTLPPPPTDTQPPVTTPPVGGASPPTGQVSLPTPGSPLPDPPQGAVNVALNKPAYQSSRSRISRPNDPQGAVDGVRDGTFGFHTDWEVHPWWLVDLGQAYLLQQLRVYNCLEYSERARFLQIDVSLDGQRWQRVHSHDGAVFGGVDGRALIVNLTNGHARYLLLRLGDAAPHYLHLDEVEAYGTPVALPTGTAPAGQQPTTPILTPQTGGTWNHGLQLDLVGGRLTIVGVAPGSASAVPLFQAGDEIVRINGADTQMMTMGNVRYLLQLPVGGQVTIQFVRPGTGLSGTIILTRQ